MGYWLKLTGLSFPHVRNSSVRVGSEVSQGVPAVLWTSRVRSQLTQSVSTFSLFLTVIDLIKMLIKVGGGVRHLLGNHVKFTVGKSLVHLPTLRVVLLSSFIKA